MSKNEQKSLPTSKSQQFVNYNELELRFKTLTELMTRTLQVSFDPRWPGREYLWVPRVNNLLAFLTTSLWGFKHTNISELFWIFTRHICQGIFRLHWSLMTLNTGHSKSILCSIVWKSFSVKNVNVCQTWHYECTIQPNINEL